MKRSYWFYLEPYVHLSLKGDHVLLYNPLNGQIAEYKNNREAAALAARLQTQSDSYVLKITEEDLADPARAQFIAKTRELFMGDLIDTAFLEKKPFQIMPQIRILRDIEKFKKEDSASVGIELMSYLSEISFYVSNVGKTDSPLFTGAYKQFLFPRNRENKEESLPFADIEQLLSETSGSSLFRVNILGGNIFHYRELGQLVELLDAFPIIKAYYFHYTDLEEGVDLKKSILGASQASAVNDLRWELDIMVHFPVDQDTLARAVQRAADSGINRKFHFIVEGEEHLERVEDVIARLEISDYTLLPYYNGGNWDFFRDAVFLDREAVLEPRPGQRDIFVRQVINQTNFGKLTVLSGGEIHANVNEPALGRLGRDSLYDIVYEEICQGRSWRRRRSEIAPCGQCVFQHLCPSPSNYEYALGKNNLCDIWSSGA